ncbi:SUKH-4 family immunity protein [Streptomyces sp. NPDC047117]|uniref:SUKH-4 family immunity protein n=1 Tax=Streptomyces sp. NPDC047117 TaxID=3155379 RepID=UPI0033E0AA9A
MVTFAQAQERAERWVNGEVPAYQQREVRVREFDLGFVAWAEDREGGPVGDGGRQRLVIARDSGETTLWPGLPVGEVIRRYEEEYGAVPDAAPAPEVPPQRIDLEQTSFLLTPPEWLQEAADAIGIPDRRSGAEPAGTQPSAAQPAAEPVAEPSAAESPAAEPSAEPAAAEASSAVTPHAEPPAAAAVPPPAQPPAAPVAPPAPPAPPVAPEPQPVTAAERGPEESVAPASGAPAAPSWEGTDITADDEADDRSVGLPATVFAPQLDMEEGAAAESDRPSVRPDAKTELLPGGSNLPRTAVAPAIEDPHAAAPGAGPVLSELPPPSGPPVTHLPPPPGAAPAPGPSAPPPAAPDMPPPAAPGTQHPAAPGAPPTAAPDVPSPAAPGMPQSAAPGTPPPPGVPGAGRPSPAEIADEATDKAEITPHDPGTPSAPPAGPAGGYVPTQLVSQLDPNAAGPAGPPDTADGAQTPPPGAPGAPAGPGAPAVPAAPGAPGGGVHAAATMLADGASLGGNPAAGRAGGGTPPPPSPPGTPGAAGPGTPPPPPPAPHTPPPAVPAAPGAPGGGVHAAATMLASPGTPPPGPGAPPAGPGAPPPAPPVGQHPGAPAGPGAYGYPQAPTGQPTVGPGYMAVLRYRAPDGSEQQIIRRSAPGTPHPEWQILHELRGLNVPPQQVLELHTELESCDLPGGYCARMIRETWPQVRISHTAAYGHDHASRQQGVRHLVEHQGELHQVADGPARPAPVRVPLPHPSQIQPVPPAPPQVIGQELEQAFGPQGVFRFDQRAVSRQGVPDVVAQTLVWAGVPVDFGPFFWGQAQPGRPVPTLAELAQERGVQPAPDAGSYLVMGTDFGRQLCVQYGTAHIVAVPLEAGPGGQAATPQFVNTGLPEFVRCLAMLGRMWRLRYGLNPEQAGRWTTDFQVQLAALDPAALGSPETWWSVLLEQMWDGLL